MSKIEILEIAAKAQQDHNRVLDQALSRVWEEI